MKRLSLLLLALCAAAAVAAMPAAAGSTSHPSLTLAPVADVTLATADATATITVSGSLVDEYAAHHHLLPQVTLTWYDDGTCSHQAGSVVLTTSRAGADTFTFSVQGTNGTVGTWSFRASTRWAVSNCVVMHVVLAEAPVVPVVVPPPPPPPSDEIVSSYLCWNHEMANPVAYIDRVADQMWITGSYFEPAAVLGHVTDGTNIGAYHLVCNTTGLTKTDLAIGGSGELYDAQANVLYHETHADRNDLNIYHVWK